MEGLVYFSRVVVLGQELTSDPRKNLFLILCRVDYTTRFSHWFLGFPPNIPSGFCGTTGVLGVLGWRPSSSNGIILLFTLVFHASDLYGKHVFREKKIVLRRLSPPFVDVYNLFPIIQVQKSNKSRPIKENPSKLNMAYQKLLQFTQKKHEPIEQYQNFWENLNDSETQIKHISHYKCRIQFSFTYKKLSFQFLKLPFFFSNSFLFPISFFSFPTDTLMILGQQGGANNSAFSTFSLSRQAFLCDISANRISIFPQMEGWL